MKVMCSNYKDCENNDWCIHSRPHLQETCKMVINSFGNNDHCANCTDKHHIRYIRNLKIEKIENYDKFSKEV